MLLPSSDINSLYNSLICFFSFQIYYYLILFGLFSLLFLSYLSLSLLSSLHPLESLGEILGKIIDGEKSVYGIISFLSCNSSHSILSLTLTIDSLSLHSFLSLFLSSSLYLVSIDWSSGKVRHKKRRIRKGKEWGWRHESVSLF